MRLSQPYIVLILVLLILFGGFVWQRTSEIDNLNNIAPADNTSKIDAAISRIPIPPIPEIKDEAKSVALTGLVREVTIKDEVKEVFPKIGELLGTSDAVNAVSDPITECTGASNPYDCYGNFLTKVVDERGIEEAFVSLKEFYNQGDTYAISQCHQLVHVIGHAATKHFPTVAEAYGHGDSFCWSGYYHGIMEAIIAKIGFESVPEKLNDICSELPGKASYTFDYYNCVHGLGHGVMFITTHELFESLTMCDSLLGGWEQESCYGGVYMENIIANDVDHATRFLKDDDPLYPCNAVEDRYKSSCYFMQTSRMLDIVNGDFNKVFELCSEADTAYINTCYQSLGRDASGKSVSDVAITKATCLLGPDENSQKNCIIGAVKDFISYFHSDVEARSLCEVIPENLQETCLNVAVSYYSIFTSS